MNTVEKIRSELAVIKIGGSVLTGLAAYESAAASLSGEIEARGGRKLLAVVSAEFGHTDALAREAAALAIEPDPGTLDLLWSTGELRSVALLTLALRQSGVPAAALNAHETGLRADEAGSETLALSGIALRAALARYSVVVVPGFLATRRQQYLTLGRGGSDLSAVLLAAKLDAGECVLIKDVDGYFTDDPATHSGAESIPALSYAESIAMADAGCPLVQRQALAAAERAGVRLVVRSFSGIGTVVSDQYDAASELRASWGAGAPTLRERAARAEWGNGAPRASA